MSEMPSVWPIRVYYEDTDAGGIVYHAQYLCFMERARTQWAEERTGVPLQEWPDRLGGTFVVRSLQATYHQPAYLGDTLEVHTRIVRVKGPLAVVEHKVMRHHVLLVRAQVGVVGLDRSGRLSRLAADVFGEAGWTH